MGARGGEGAPSVTQLPGGVRFVAGIAVEVAAKTFGASAVGGGEGEQGVGVAVVEEFGAVAHPQHPVGALLGDRGRPAGKSQGEEVPLAVHLRGRKSRKKELKKKGKVSKAGCASPDVEFAPQKRDRATKEGWQPKIGIAA